VNAGTRTEKPNSGEHHVSISQTVRLGFRGIDHGNCPARAGAQTRRREAAQTLLGEKGLPAGASDADEKLVVYQVEGNEDLRLMAEPGSGAALRRLEPIRHWHDRRHEPSRCSARRSYVMSTTSKLEAAMKRASALILSAALVIAVLPGNAHSAQTGHMAAGSKYHVQNPKGFNPQPDPPSRKFLGGPDTKSLGGPDTKSLGGPDTKRIKGLRN
jgi:hypothetical protein